MKELSCPMGGLCDEIDCPAKRLRERYFREVEEVHKNKMAEDPNQDRVLELIKAHEIVNLKILAICNSK